MNITTKTYKRFTSIILSAFIFFGATNCNNTTFEEGVNLLSGNGATQAPSISKVRATTLNGTSPVPANSTLTTGDTLLISVDFSQNVTVDTSGGIPTLQLAPGVIATYSSGSTTSTLVFTYVVQRGDFLSPLDYANASSLALNGATIQNSNGTTATLTLPSPGSINSISGSLSAAIWGVPVITTVSSLTGTGTYGPSFAIDLELTFSEAVDVTGTPSIALNTGGSAIYTSGTGTPTLTFTYTVGANDTTLSPLDYTNINALALNGGTITAVSDTQGASTVLPAAWNTDIGKLSGTFADVVTIGIHTVKPYIVNVTSSKPDGAYSTGAVIQIEVQFDEPMIVSGGAPTFTVETGASDGIAVFAGITTTTGSPNTNDTLLFDYTVAAGETSADLDYIATPFNLAGTKITDQYGSNADLATLPAPGTAGSLGANKAIVIDTSIPVVNEAIAQNLDGYYVAGDSVQIDLVFNEVVLVSGGTPTLALNTTPARSATYISGSGTNTLRFAYTIASGDLSGNAGNGYLFDYSGTNALALNGSTIIDSGGNTAVLTLAAPGSLNSVSDNQNIIIDAKQPVVTTITAVEADGTYGIGQAITVQVVMSEPVIVNSGTGIPTLTLETGTTDAVVSYTSLGTTTLTNDTIQFLYTIAPGDTSADLDYKAINSLLLNNGTITDLAGNNGNFTLPSPGAANSLGANKALVIDGIIPTILNVTAANGNGTYGNNVTLNIDVQYSAVVTVTGTPTISLGFDGPLSRTASYSSGTGTNMVRFTYTTVTGDNTADLAYNNGSISLPTGGDTITSIAGNNASNILPAAGTAGSLDANNNVIVDTITPTVTGVSVLSPAGTYGVGQTINIQVNFSEAVTVTTAPSLALNTTPARSASCATVSNASTMTCTYTVVAGDTTSGGNLNHTGNTSLSGGVGSDQASPGNNINFDLTTAGALGGNVVVIDGNVPAVTNVTATTANGAYKAGDTVVIHVIFSEALIVSGGTPQLTLETGTTDAVVAYSSLATTNVPNDTMVFNYTVSAGETSADLDYFASTSLAANGATITNAGATNNATLTLPAPATAGSLGSNKNIVIDTTTPTITNVTATNTDGTYGIGSVISLQVVFSEPVTVAVATPVIDLNSSAATNEAQYSGGSTTNTLTFQYTVVSGDAAADLDYTGTTALSLAGATITDNAGNNANLALFSPGTAGSLGANKNIAISTIALSVQFNTTSSANSENITSVSIPVSLNTSSVNTVTVDYSVTGGSAHSMVSPNPATGNGDYTLAAGTLTFNPGIMGQNLTLTINNDLIDEPAAETVVITLSNPVNASLGTNTTHTYTINDDDAPPTVSFVSTTSATANESATPHNIYLALDSVSENTVTATLDDSTPGSQTATAGSDYNTFNPATVTFNPGDIGGNPGTKLITLTPIDDVVDEGSGETVIFNITGFTNALLGAVTSHTSTITDDDGVPTLSVLDTSITEGDAGTVLATISVNLAGSSASGASVTYTTVNGTATAGSDYTATSGTLNWGAGISGIQTFQITINGDTLGELNETLFTSLSIPVNATIANGTGTLTILNDDLSLLVSTAETLDCDPIDGVIDHYKITFNTSVTDSTFTGYTLNGEGAITAKWVIAGMNNPRLDHGTALSSFCGTDTANDNILYLKFNQSINPNTGVAPDITTAAATIAAGDGRGAINFNTGNIFSADISESDKAAPVVWQANATHVGGIDGSASTGDKLVIQFSESTNAPSLSGTDLDTVLCASVLAGDSTCTISNAFGASTDITSALWSTTVFNNDTLTIIFANSVSVYDGNFVKLQGTTITDTSLNNPPAIASVFSPPSIGGTFDSGNRGPVIITAEYFDLDSNGKIDHLKIVFDKAVNDSTFPGYVGPNQINTVTTAWQISGHSGVAMNTTDTVDGIGGENDNIIWLNFSENTLYDTGAKPDLTATAGAAGLRDIIAGSTCYINTTASNCLNAAAAVVSTTHIVEQDMANPIITLTTVRTDARYIYTRFSENVWGSPGTPSCTAGGQITASDFVYNDLSASNASTVAGVDALDRCAANDGTVILLSDQIFNVSEINVDQVRAATNSIYDAADNVAPDSIFSTLYAVTRPYIITAGSYKSGTQYFIRIVYSEPMNAVSATTAANYTITEDTPTACPDLTSTVPLSINAISETVFDLETSAQCGTGNTNPTIYRVTGSSAIFDFAEVAPLGLPNSATAPGTGDNAGLDKTPPSLLQALSTGANTVQLTYSEPMLSGNQNNSATCDLSYGTNPATATDCATDVDTVGAGINLKYTITPSLGAITSVLPTANTSVYTLTHNDIQQGNFFTVAAYAYNNVANIPADTAGNLLPAVPYDRATFEGTGTAIVAIADGPLFTDPFADTTEFSFAFNYSNQIYLGPNLSNKSAFRFEPDGANPTTVTFFAKGASCANGTTTFGFGTPTTCNVDMGPNGERGIVGFNSGLVTLNTVDYELLMVGPIKDGISHFYYTQDIDTTLDWKSCTVTGTNGVNSKSLQTLYTFGSDIYAAIASNHNTNSPILNKVPLTQTNGVISCLTPVDLTGKNITLIGKASTNPAPNGTTIGIDSMYFDGANFFLANNGGLVHSVGAPAANTSFLAIKSQAQFGGTTLALPDEVNGGLEKVRPGQRGVPIITKWNGAMYLARNLAVNGTTGITTHNGGEIWKCTATCTNGANWTKVLDVRISGSAGGLPAPAIGSAANNLAISMLEVNGDYLYIGVDNDIDGVRIFRTNTGITTLDGGIAPSSLMTEQADPGLGYNYVSIFSSASLPKQGKSYIYITVSNGPLTSIKVVRQVD